jgi:hypothetical protein
MKDHSNTLVSVLTASLIHEIHIAKTLLANYDIQSYIIDEHLMTTIGTAFVEGYKLKVNVLDFEKASKLLNDVDANNN